MAAIGIGSALFHTFATTWAGVLDLAPILVFQGYFLWLYCRRVASLGSSASALLVGGLLFAAVAGRALPHGNEWSLAYIPALIPLLGWGVYHCYTQKREPLALATAAGIFALALTFRTLDGVVCPLFPLGTHFLWHLLNASVLYLLFKALVANGRFGPGPSPGELGPASIPEVTLSSSEGLAGRTTAPGGFPDAPMDQPVYTSIGVSSRPAHSLIERS